MKMVRIAGVIGFVSLVVACSSSSSSSSSSSGGTADSGAKDAGVDAVSLSECGHPGDVGNELGVGKFCQTITDCSANSKATLCTTLGDAKNFFCTASCTDGGPANQCGSAAHCACQSGQCGCYPDACGGAPDAAAGSDAAGD
jgi:hypothetical protein